MNMSQAKLIDAHCHIQLQPLFDRAQEAIVRARSVGIDRAVVCGVCPGEDWLRVQQLATLEAAFVVPAFGLHPWWIKRYFASRSLVGDACPPCDSATFDAYAALEVDLREAVGGDARACVGECGLDKPSKKQVPLDVQEAVLERHVHVAADLQRPLILHCVGSWGRLHGQLQRAPSGIPSVILHSCNSMDVQMLPAFLRLPSAVYFSFNGCAQGASFQSLLRAVPRERLLIETDSPDQLPTEADVEVGTASVGNEPAVLAFTCRKVAGLLGLPSAEVAALTYANAQAAFRLL